MTRRAGLLLDPLVAFPILWSIGVLLAWLDPIGAEVWEWSSSAWAVMAAVPVTFVLGGMLGKWMIERTASPGTPKPSAPSSPPKHSRAAVRTVLVLCVIVGYVELAHQFAAAGSIPLLSSNIDAARFAQAGGPTILLTDLLTVAIVAALSLPSRLMTRAALPEIAIAAVAASGFALAGGRGTVVLPLIAVVFARTLMHGAPPVRVLLGGAAAVVIALGGLFFVRTAQHRENPFEEQLYNETLPDLPPVAQAYLPLHYGYPVNFDVLAALVDQFPAAEPYGGGAFSTSGFDLIVPGARPLGSVTSKLTPPFVTATVAGPFLADGGLGLVVLGVAAVGAATGAAYGRARLTRSPPACLVAGHLGTMAIFGVYANLFTDHPDWVVVLPALAGVGWLASGSLKRSRPFPAPPAGVGDFAGRYAPALIAQLATALRKAVHATRISLVSSWLRRQRVVLCIAMLVLLGIAAVVFEVVRDPQAKPPRPGPPLPVTNRFSLPSSFIAGSTLATDGDLRTDNAPLWSFRRARGRTEVQQMNFERERPQTERTTLGVPPTGASDRVLDVVEWPSGDAAVEMALGEEGVGVRVLSLVRPGRVESTGFARLSAPLVRRDVAVATWSKTTPDLFLIDRGGPRERVRITIWSGESGFRERIGDFRVPLRGLRPNQWTLDVARLSGNRPDLLALKLRGSGSSTHPEVHVLSGDQDYAQFALENPIDVQGLPVAPPAAIGGTTLGRASLFLVQHNRMGGGALISIPLFPPRVGNAL